MLCYVMLCYVITSLPYKFDFVNLLGMIFGERNIQKNGESWT